MAGTAVVDVIKKKMRQQRDELEAVRDEVEDCRRQLKVEVQKREDVGVT